MILRFGRAMRVLAKRRLTRLQPRWLASPLDDQPLAAVAWVSLDTETTGLDVQHDRIVQIGAVTMRGPEVEDDLAFDSLVNPGRPIPKRSSAIHGIDDAAVATAPRFGELATPLGRLCADRLLVGHNVGFDAAMLARESKLAEISWQRPPTLCTTQLYAALHPRARNLNLEAVAERYEISVVERHKALADAQLTAKVFACLTRELEPRGIATVGEARRFCFSAREVVRRQYAAGW